MPDNARRLAIACLVILTVIATVTAAKVASAILAPTVLACLFALTLAPLVAALEKRHVPPAAAAGAVVRKNPEAATVDEHVVHEVNRPALVLLLRDRHWRSGAKRPLAAAAPPNRQLFLAVDPE